MFFHKHPYEPFIPRGATKLIVGTLPPPRFSVGDLKPDDVNFCYGSRDGQLWPILATVYNMDLLYDNSMEAVMQRKVFLESRGIGICDIVASCKRDKIDASDLGMQDVKLRHLLSYIKIYPKIDTLLFTGGNSKNGPEYFFRKHLKDNGMKLKLVSKDVPRIHQFNLNCLENQTKLGQQEIKSHFRTIKTVSLTAPSGSANRAIGSMDLYKQLKAKNSKFNTFDFRVMQYRKYF